MDFDKEKFIASKTDDFNCFFNNYKLYFDGCCKNNGKSYSKGAAGFVLYHNNIIIFEGYEFYDFNVTNNVTEYKSLILGLKKAISLNIKNIDIYGDSNLVINQLNGNFSIKSKKLIPLYNEASDLLKIFNSYRLKHILRDKNKKADELANFSFYNKITKL